MTIISAHREPDVFFEWAKAAEGKGIKVPHSRFRQALQPLPARSPSFPLNSPSACPAVRRRKPRGSWQQGSPILLSDLQIERKRIMPKVGIVMGSDSDLKVMSKAAVMLEKLGVDYEMTIISAHPGLPEPPGA